MRYLDLIAADSPLQLYTFDDPAGSLFARDSVGLLGAAVSGAVSFNQAGLLLNKSCAKLTGGYFDLGLHASGLYTGAAGVTFELIVRVDTLPTGTDVAHLFGLLTNGGSALAAASGSVHADGSIEFGGRSKQTDGYQVLTTPASLVSAGSWMLLHFVQDFANGATKVYVSGAPYSVSSTFGSSTYQANSSTYRDAIGAYTYLSAGNALCSLALWAMYGSALSADKIAERNALWDKTWSVPVVTTIDGVSVSRKVRVSRAADGFSWPAVDTASDGTGSVLIDDDGPVNVVAFDFYGDRWRPSTDYGADALVTPNVPNAHWYQTSGGGTSGAAEPSWPTDGSTVTDGTVTWTDMGTMRAPVIQGPFIPVAA